MVFQLLSSGCSLAIYQYIDMGPHHSQELMHEVLSLTYQYTTKLSYHKAISQLQADYVLSINQ